MLVKSRCYLVLSLISLLAVSCGRKSDVAYQDLTHSSTVFHKSKYYRLYLPAGYDQGAARYPVIYFFHGWGGRHFKDDNANLEYAKIKKLVDKYQIILVMWDGNYDEKEPRPYNIGYHEDITSDIQMKDYFLELVGHVDSTYRTLIDRGHRGIIGFSMGGFLSYFLAGKYPDRVSAAVNMTGSPEFFVGTPQTHTLYPVRYAFKNLSDVRLRFHNSTADELTYLNSEVDNGARWEGGLSYDYWQFVGGHVVDKPGEIEVFERAMKFVATAFENPLPVHERWSHYDIYSDFGLWDYEVTSNKKESGFIYLSRVSSRGFGISTLKWLPDGPPMDACVGGLVTAAIYEPEVEYRTKVYEGPDKPILRAVAKSDKKGRLHFVFNSRGYEMGVFREGATPDLIAVGYSMDSQRRFIRPGKENMITITLFNRGGDVMDGGTVKITLSSQDSSVQLVDPQQAIEWKMGESVLLTRPFRVMCSKGAPPDASPSAIKLKMKMEVGISVFDDEMIIPVFFDAKAFESLAIDDGSKVNDTVNVYGKGNGDGNVSPGEQIMVYTNGHRTRLYTDDPWVVKDQEHLVDEVLPAKWPDGFTLTSVIAIDKRCPVGHKIECLANYETKSFMPIGRKLTWGKVSLIVNR